MRAGIEHLGFEPTVFGAVRRYGSMVVAVALITAFAAVGYTLVQPELYRATATVSVPQPLLSEGQASDQYLDSQVLLLQSPDVADRAVRIANGALGSDVLADHDFSGDAKAVEILPPEGTTPGAYGATIVTVSFTWPDPRIAQVGVNAFLQGFDDARSAAIAAQGEATVASIQRANQDARTQGQRTDLTNQRTQALVSQQVDLARHPTIAWAAEPQTPVNGNSKRTGVIGLVIGGVLGAALAYARASRRRSFDDRLDPEAVYAAPLMAEIPAAEPSIAADPHPAVAEEFRFAAGALDRFRAMRGPRMSLVFLSPGTGAATSAVVADIAVAMAESGTRVLAVDAVADGDLTTLLLPSGPDADGFQQVIAGQRRAAACIEPSALHDGVQVMRSGPRTTNRVAGASYSGAVRRLLAEVEADFDMVLVDSPALLRVASATELVAACDAAVVVISAHDPVQDHLDVVERLDLTGSEVAGYLYRRARRPSHRHLAQYLRERLSARSARSADPTGSPVGAAPHANGRPYTPPSVIPSTRR